MENRSDIAKRYATAAARLTALVEAVPSDAWDRASPCDEWAAGEVLDHVVSTELDFLGQHGFAKPEVSSLDRVAAWAATRDAMQSVLDDPATATLAFDGFFGPTTVEKTVDQFYCLDLLVHRWDLASAVGLGEHATLDDGEVAQIRTRLDGIPPEVMRAPGLFGPEVEPSATADETTA